MEWVNRTDMYYELDSLEKGDQKGCGGEIHRINSMEERVHKHFNEFPQTVGK